MELTYTQTLIDTCPKPLECSRCGRVFEVGEMIHEVPFGDEYKLVCHGCRPFPDLGRFFECDDCSWCGKPTMPGDTMFHITTKGLTRIYCSKCGKAIKDRI